MIDYTSYIQSKREKTEFILQNIYNLPPIPKAVDDVMHLLNIPTTNTTDLSEIIGKDQSLTTKILTVANSPLYGLRRKVTSIEFAILILGFAELRNIISVLSMIDSFKNNSDNFFDTKAFWLHSFLVGLASKRIVDDLNLTNSGEAFIAGFLHDIGLSVMHKNFHDKYLEITSLAKQGYSYNEAEIQILGMTHQDVGAFLLNKWNFPSSIIEGIKFHQSPSAQEVVVSLPFIINAADYLTEKFSIGNFEWDKGCKLDENTTQVLLFQSDEQLESYLEGLYVLFNQEAENIGFLS